MGNHVSFVANSCIPESRVLITVPQAEQGSLTIDEKDYLAVRRILKHNCLWKHLQNCLWNFVAILEDDDHRRVYKLSFKYHSIRYIPESIGRMEHLVSLDLCQTSLRRLPKSIGKLKNLQILDLSHTKWLTELPNEIGGLITLRTLNLRRSAIKSIGPSIGELKNLQDLDLSYTKMQKTLPQEIKNLVKLNTLNFSEALWLCHHLNEGVWNEELKNHIVNLSSLVKLNLKSTKIGLLPATIGNLKNLKYLNLRSTTRLIDLPDEFGNLSNLTKLDLSRSMIACIPSTIGQLKSLKDLSLRATERLVNLPKEIGGLASLVELDLYCSSIRSLPPSIGQLKNLKLLFLAFTLNLSDIPDEIGNLTSLKVLKLNGSGIQSIPASVTKLQNLNYLGLHNISSICNKTRHEGLLTLAQSCRSLVDINLPGVTTNKKIIFALTCNRWRKKSPFSGAKVQSHLMTPNLWPLVLSHARRSLDFETSFWDYLHPTSFWFKSDARRSLNYETSSLDSFAPTSFWMKRSRFNPNPLTTPDIVFQILVGDTESFLGVAMARNRNE